MHCGFRQMAYFGLWGLFPLNIWFDEHGEAHAMQAGTPPHLELSIAVQSGSPFSLPLWLWREACFTYANASLEFHLIIISWRIY